MGFGIVLMIVVFVVIIVINRKFYMWYIRENVYYVGLVVIEYNYILNNLDRIFELYISYCSVSEVIESSIYMLVSLC